MTYTLKAYTASPNECIFKDNGVIEMEGFSEVENITMDEIKEFHKQFDIFGILYGYGLVTIKNSMGFPELEAFLHPYFRVKDNYVEKVMTPVKVEDKWYLSEDDMYLTDEILRNIKKDRFTYPYIVKNEDMYYGLYLIPEYFHNQNCQINLIEELENSYLDGLLDYLGDMGIFIRESLNKKKIS